jgi:hypothetical protein
VSPPVKRQHACRVAPFAVRIGNDERFVEGFTNPFTSLVNQSALERVRAALAMRVRRTFTDFTGIPYHGPHNPSSVFELAIRASP